VLICNNGVDLVLDVAAEWLGSTFFAVAQNKFGRKSGGISDDLTAVQVGL